MNSTSYLGSIRYGSDLALFPLTRPISRVNMAGAKEKPLGPFDQHTLLKNTSIDSTACEYYLKNRTGWLTKHLSGLEENLYTLY